MDNIIIPIALAVPIAALIFTAGVQWQRIKEMQKQIDRYNKITAIMVKKMRLPAEYEYGNGESR